MLTLARLNALPPGEAAERLRACCGSSRWVEAMLAGRPFETVADLLGAADEAWGATGPDDWDEAFAHHPRIGGRHAAAPVSATARAWSASEQGIAAAAGAPARAALAEASEAYERRFGRIYIVCAAGRSVEEILADIAVRLKNDPDRERAIAAEEQRKITRLRLETLIGARGAMTRITSHVLDTSTGRPAAGLTVRLERSGPGPGEPGRLASATTDPDGRVRDWLPAGVPVGRYRLVFETGAWFRTAGRDTLYSEVIVEFEVQDEVPHYHLPLLLSPFGYSTYRGS